jgi:hypothetical protein
VIDIAKVLEGYYWELKFVAPKRRTLYNKKEYPLNDWVEVVNKIQPAANDSLAISSSMSFGRSEQKSEGFELSGYISVSYDRRRKQLKMKSFRSVVLLMKENIFNYACGRNKEIRRWK